MFEYSKMTKYEKATFSLLLSINQKYMYKIYLILNQSCMKKYAHVWNTFTKVNKLSVYNY